jgi:hypothetical protein
VRLLDKRSPPDSGPIDRPRRKQHRIETISDNDALPAIDAEQADRPIDITRRLDHDARAELCPAPHPASPCIGMRPVGRSAVVDLLEHHQFSSV